MSQSQRTLKCTVCSGNHVRMHCDFICSSCGGDKRKCECQTQTAVQKKRKQNTAKRGRTENENAAAADDEPTYDQLCRMYNKLQKRHEDVGKAYQTIKKQYDEMVAVQEQKDADLEEANGDAEELADLVRTKDGVIKDLQASLTTAKDEIARLKDELRKRPASQPVPDEPDTQTVNRVTTLSLASIHERYARVLDAIRQHRCSMANAFRIASCPRSTVRDFVAIAELKIVDGAEHDLVVRDQQGTSVKELEVVCRRRLRRHLPVLADLRREGKLLPLKFDHRFYE